MFFGDKSKGDLYWVITTYAPGATLIETYTHISYEIRDFTRVPHNDNLFIFYKMVKANTIKH